MAGSDEDGARTRVDPARPVVGRELSRLDASPELVEPTAPEERRPPARADLAVEEDREAELGADARRENASGVGCSVDRIGCEWDDRHDVGRADARMDARVLTQVDELDRRCDAGEEGLEEVVGPRGEGVDGAVVIGIGVRVEQRSTAGEGVPDRGNDLQASPFRDVGHCLEHDPYPTKR